MQYIYTMEHYSAIKKEQNNASCSDMKGPGVSQRKISYNITYM